MKNYEYDVFLSFTGADREMKTYLREQLESPRMKLSSYDSDLYCQGQFRDDYCTALDQSRVYLMILSDNLRNDPNITGKGCLTEVRRECDLACQLEAAGELNIVILCMSEFFRFDHPFHDYNDIIGWHFYSHTRGFTRIDAVVNEDGSLSDQTLEAVLSQCKSFVDKRLAGHPVPSQAPRLEIASEKMLERGVFKGRETEIEAALAAFGAGKRAVVLSGMGGIGKTALATEIARRCEELGYLRCPQIVHVQELGGAGGGLHTIVSSVRYEQSVYSSLSGLAERDKYERKLSALAALPETVLLVVDNYNALAERDVADAISKLKCRILITTRARVELSEREVEVISIGCLAEEQACEAFCEISGQQVDPDLFSKIYHFVGGHTITLCIMAKMIAVHRMPVEALLFELGELEAFDAKVNFEHNEYGDADTVLGHLKKLFGISDFSEGCKRVLRSMAILGDGTVAVDVLMRVLGLRNRNEIIQLTESGWLELQKREEQGAMREYLYLHPILSRLMANLLVPTEQNVAEMIGYLVDHTDSAKDKMTFADATVMEDGLFYACYVLAGGDKHLSHELWQRFVEMNHLLGDVEGTTEKVKALSARLGDEKDRQRVISYGDMVIIEQFPTRVDIIEKYVNTLERGAADYRWLMRSLSITLPHVVGVEKFRPFLTAALNKAFQEAMEQKDDLALLELLKYFAGIGGDGRHILRRLQRYICARKKEGGSNGTLLMIETFCLSYRYFSVRDLGGLGENASEALDAMFNEKFGWAFAKMLLHPVTALRIFGVQRRAKKLPAVDPMFPVWQAQLGLVDRMIADGVLDAPLLIEAAVNLHQLRMENGLTLSSATNAVLAVISMINALPESFVQKGVGQLVEGVDMENISIRSLSSLQVAALINRNYGNREALEQSRQVLSVVRRLRPEGHADVLDALIDYGQVCSSFGENDEALRAYGEAYLALCRAGEDSARLAMLSRSMLRLPSFASVDAALLKDVLDRALSELDADSAYYYDVYSHYMKRLKERAEQGIITYENEAFGLARAVFERAALQPKLTLAAQNAAVNALESAAVAWIQARRYGEAETLCEILERFSKSKKKSVRINARIRLLNVRAYAAYFKSEPTCIAMMHSVVEACTKHRSHMNIASVNTLLIFTELARREKEIDLAQLIETPKTRALAEAYVAYLKEECIGIEGQNGVAVPANEDIRLRAEGAAFLVSYRMKEIYNQNMNVKWAEFKRMKRAEQFYFRALKNTLADLVERYEKEPYRIPYKLAKKPLPKKEPINVGAAVNTAWGGAPKETPQTATYLPGEEPKDT